MIGRRCFLYLAHIMLCCACNHAPPVDAAYPTLGYERLEEMNISLPYIKEYGSRKKLLVYGSNHTNNPQDAQIGGIGKKILALRPDLILYEGDDIATEGDRSRTIETYFEMGFVKFLADSLHTEYLNIEPPAKEKYEWLLQKHPRQEVMLATLGLQITMLQANGEDFELQYPAMVKSLADEGFPLSYGERSLSHFYKIYRDYFGSEFSYQHFDSRKVQSKYTLTTLNAINQAANQYRDQHILRLIAREIKTKQRIYLQIGGWHAIVCGPAFEQIMQVSQ